MADPGGGRIDRPKLAGNVRSVAERLARQPDGGIVRPSVSTQLVQDVAASSRFEQYDRQFEFRCDESVDRGGAGEQPSPLRYLLSGLAFCLQVWCAKAAALRDVRIDDLRVDVTTLMDMRGEHLVDDHPPHPQRFDVTIDIVTPAGVPDDVLLAITSDAMRRCPVSSLLSRAVPVRLAVLADGRPLDDGSSTTGPR